LSLLPRASSAVDRGAALMHGTLLRAPAGLRVPPVDRASWMIDEEAVTALTGLDQFERAMLAGASALIDLYRDNWVLNRVMNDRGKLVAALIILDLHYRAAGCGFAVAQLREQALRYAFASPNRVTDLVAALRGAGFLQSVAASDARLRKLAPTETFLSLHRRRFRSQLDAQALVRPQIAPGIATFEEPSFFGDFIHGRLTWWRLGIRATRGHPGLESLVERANAMPMLLAVFVAEAQGTVLGISDLARRFVVARSHVVSVMKEAEGYGLVRLDPSPRRYRPTLALRTALGRFFAVTFLRQAKAIDYAMMQKSNEI
jgi:hypothetical protein